MFKQGSGIAFLHSKNNAARMSASNGWAGCRTSIKTPAPLVM
jgi:hypothetical protein